MSRSVQKPSAAKNIRGVPPSYDTETRFESGAYQTIVIARCAECDKTHELHWNTGGKDPAFVEKKFRGMGWHFDAFKPKNCVCPECVGGKIAPDDGLTKEELSMATTTKQGANDPSGYRPPNKSDTALGTMVNARTGNVDPPPVPRQLTAHEKTKVRHLLDSHFDDARGRYLENYNDRKIGEECDVPWALVTQIREMAYGPLKDDPEVVAFKAEAAAIRQEFMEFMEATTKTLNEMRAATQKIEGRLLNLEGRAKRM